MPRDSPAERAHLASRARALYESGMTLVEVASTLSVSYGKAHALLLASGGSPRRRGARPRPPKEDPQ